MPCFSLQSYIEEQSKVENVEDRRLHPFIIFQGFRKTGKTTHIIGLLAEQPTLFDVAFYFSTPFLYESRPDTIVPAFWNKCIKQNVDMLDMIQLRKITDYAKFHAQLDPKFRALVVIEDWRGGKFIKSPEFLDWVKAAGNNNITVMMAHQYQKLAPALLLHADIIVQNEERSLNAVEKLREFPFHQLPISDSEAFNAVLDYFTKGYSALVAVKNIKKFDCVYEYMWHKTDIATIKQVDFAPSHCLQYYDQQNSTTTSPNGRVLRSLFHCVE